MKRLALILGACGALAVSACGGDDTTPVDGQTTPSTVGTQPQGTVTIADQLTKLKSCLGGEQVTRVDVFEPTYELAVSQGGGGFAVLMGAGKDEKQIEFLVFPDAAAAQAGYEDAQNRLISLQQEKPEDYARIAATAMQVLGNVVEIVPTGPPAEEVNTKLVGCVTSTGQPPAST